MKKNEVKFAGNIPATRKFTECFAVKILEFTRIELIKLAPENI